MIEHVDIKNFKCLRDVSLDLAPLTVLIGPNDSGKSSFLESLSIVSRAFATDDSAFVAQSEMRSLAWLCEPEEFEFVVRARWEESSASYRLAVYGAALRDWLDFDGSRLFEKKTWRREDDSPHVKIYECIDLGIPGVNRCPVGLGESGWKHLWQVSDASDDGQCDFE